MSLPHLSLADARNLHLAAQGLLNKPRRRASLEDIPATISRMSLLQIDTINIVARSPYLVLFSRLGNYPAQWLDESLARGELMEYWAHEAALCHAVTFVLFATACWHLKKWAGNTKTPGCRNMRRKLHS